MSQYSLRDLDGKVAVVTGAGRGIGRAIALLLASHGVRTVVNDLGVARDGTCRAEEPASDVVWQIRSAGGQAVASFASVADWDGAASIIQAAIDNFGGIDILVNAAGLASASRFEDLGEDEFDAVVGASLNGTFFCTKHAVPHMMARGGGRIVNFVSRAGLVGIAGASAYAAAKGGVFGLTNALARELLPHGIFVNGVNPAATRTRMLGGRDAGGDADELQKRMMAVMQEPENVAVVVACLCAEWCRLSGQYILVEKQGISLLPQILPGKRSALSPDEWAAETIGGELSRYSNNINQLY